MKKRYAIYIMLALVCMLASACSKKGSAMPKHRKRKHCDCPYFSQVMTPADSVEYHA